MLLRHIAKRMAFMLSTTTFHPLTVRKYSVLYRNALKFTFASLKAQGLQTDGNLQLLKSFADIEMPQGLKSKLVEAFPCMTEIQQKTAQLLLDGEDMIGVAKTGSGKTLAYALPILLKLAQEPKQTTSLSSHGPRYLIICPTRELAMQILDHVSDICYELGLKAGAVFGGEDRQSQAMKLRRGVDVLVGTPGRLMDFMGSRKIPSDRIAYLTLDEADRILEIGFEQQLREIANLLPQKNRQTSFWSATWNRKIESVANDYIKSNAKYIQIGNNELSFNSDVTQKFELATNLDDKLKKIIQHIRDNPSAKIMVFCNTKHLTNALEDELRAEKISTSKLNGDLGQSQRTRNLDRFKLGIANILIATDVAARGLDIKDVHFVINFDTPKDVQSYIHRIGRTGRAGSKGVSITYLCGETLPFFTKDLIALMREHKIPISKELQQFQNTNGSYSRRTAFSRYADHNRGYQREQGDSFGSQRESFHSERNQFRNNSHSRNDSHFRSDSRGDRTSFGFGQADQDRRQRRAFGSREDPRSNSQNRYFSSKPENSRNIQDQRKRVNSYLEKEEQ